MLLKRQRLYHENRKLQSTQKLELLLILRQKLKKNCPNLFIIIFSRKKKIGRRYDGIYLDSDYYQLFVPLEKVLQSADDNEAQGTFINLNSDANLTLLHSQISTHVSKKFTRMSNFLIYKNV